MLTFNNTVIIERPLAEVFQFVCDQENNSKWNYFIVRVEQTNSCFGLGAEYLQVRKNDQQRFQIVEFLLDQRCTIATLPGERPAVTRRLCFKGNSKQTAIYDQIDLHVPLPRLLSPMLTARMRSAVQRNLECLKRLLETGEVVLQDGRKERVDSCR